jgi:choice-of-anchor A domain-containing protein
VTCLVGSASAKMILYTTQTNASGPGGDYPANTVLGSTWTNDVCGGKAFPLGIQTEWTPILDPPNQDAETNLVAVSGTVAYNPQPDESGYCQGPPGAPCPGEPVDCSSDADCGASACNGVAGTCDLAQGPSCTGGGCNSPWSDPQVGSPIACVSDAQCGACGGTCTALGRSRGDLVSTHPFGFDWDAAIAPDPTYLSLLAPGNVESYHLAGNSQAVGGFEDVVYPFLHATTPVGQQSLGWCAPDFSDRCLTNADCASGICEGNVTGLGLSTDPNTLPGTLGMETDHDLFPDAYQPHDGDRAAVFGRWIVDCGHGDQTNNNVVTPGFHTEIHPPLLFATGRNTGHGAFNANCSGEQTCVSVIGRPFLISQSFGDGDFLKHLAHEAEKLGCVEVTGPAFEIALRDYAGLGFQDCTGGLNPACVCNGDAACIACESLSCTALDTCGACAVFPPACGACAISSPPFGLTCTTQLEERPSFSGVPFAGTQDMQYYVQPANDRLHPGDRMLVEWHMTARNGVTVALSNGGDAAGVLVDVSMDPSKYHPAARPPKQDWAWHDSRTDTLQTVLDIFAGIFPQDIPQAVILANGIFSDRYQAPEAPANDSAPTMQFADALDATVQAAQTIDDSQPFPVSGRINVGWFRCNAGGPYGADCAGLRTNVTLNGAGSSDPDGKPLTYTWSGPFLGGTASGIMPTVQFNGSGTFPVTLTVDNGSVHTSCKSSVTIRPAAVLQLGGGNVNATGTAGGVNGDVCVGPSGSLDVTGAQFVTGSIHLAPGDPLTKSGTGTIGPVLRNQDLSPEIAPTLAAASQLAALPCTQTFATLKASTTIVGTGGQNVICVGDLMLSGSSTVVLSGGPADTFVVNISGKLKLTDSARIVASGVPQSAIIYDLVGTGQQVVLSSRTSAPCCSASLDGTLLAVGRAVSFGAGLVNGEIISAQSIGLGGGSSVH